MIWWMTIAMLLTEFAPAPYRFTDATGMTLYEPTSSTGYLITMDKGFTVAVFAVPQRGKFEFDTRCVIVVSRDRKSGWLIDRIENTVRSWEGTDHPAWCDEGKASR